MAQRVWTFLFTDIEGSTRKWEADGDALPPGWSLRLLGRFALKDLSRPENLFQALVPGLRADFPILRSLDGSPHNLPLQPTHCFDREFETAEIMRELCDSAARPACAAPMRGPPARPAWFTRPRTSGRVAKYLSSRPRSWNSET
jgi:hypothetical protein